MDELTATFTHLSARSLERIAHFAEHGGAPLQSWEYRVLARAYKLAGNNEDTAALLYCAAEYPN